MRTKDVVWLILLILAVLLTVCLKYLPYLPGDVIVTRLIQSVLPESKDWAQVMSSTAEMPWILGLIAVTFMISWMIAGWRARFLSLAASSAYGYWENGLVQLLLSPDLLLIWFRLQGRSPVPHSHRSLPLTTYRHWGSWQSWQLPRHQESFEGSY